MMRAILVALGVLLASGVVLAADQAAPTGGDASGKVFERRIYKANPGKIEALHARFRDHTCRLFKKHGIEVIGFWTPVDEEDLLIYLVAFPSIEAQKKAWEAFRNDPEWKEAKANSERDGVLVKEIQTRNLKATNYSPIR